MDTARPIATLEEYRRATEHLKRRLAGDSQAAALAREIERLVRFELEHRVPESGRVSTHLGTPLQPPPRRTALISDIHGSHAGLLAALDDIGRQDCDRIVCLGDLVEGGTENDEVIEVLRRHQVPCIRGNHDAINDVALSAASRQFLDNLPLQQAEGDVLHVHISPRAIGRKIDNPIEAWNVFEETSYRLIFIGHVHIPYIFGKRSAAYGEAMRHAFEYNRPFQLSTDDSYIVSVGSIGYGRDKVGRIRYAIHDREANTVELRAVDGPLLPLDYALR